jgi:hypothetical protein
LLENEVLVELLQEHFSTERIAEKLNCSPGNVLYWERKYGLRPAFAACGDGRRVRTPEEMSAFMISDPTIRRRKLKAKAIAFKGGKCMMCGYSRCNAALEFHHVDRTTKGFGLSRKGIIRSRDSIEQEIRKCILICANCHREVEAGLRTIPPLK